MRRSLAGLTILLAMYLAMTMTSNGIAQGRPDKPKMKDAERDEFLQNFKRIGLNTTPGDAMMLRILIQSHNAQRGVEVGSATGFGAMHMGIGFARTGGHLETIDIDPDMVRTCRSNLKKLGLEKTVTAIEGDALKVLPKLQGEYDFIFIDAVKRDYLKYFKAIEPKLKPGAVIVADNVIRSRRAMQDFLDFMATSPDYDMVIIRASDEKQDGMAICYKIRYLAKQTGIETDSAQRATIGQLQATRVETLRKIVEIGRAEHERGLVPTEDVLATEHELVEAQLDAATTQTERLAVLKEALQLAQNGEKIAAARYESAHTTIVAVLKARATRLHAEIRLQRERERGASPEPQG
jgi:predicted O-methyltransferase YrrM